MRDIPDSSDGIRECTLFLMCSSFCTAISWIATPKQNDDEKQELWCCKLVQF